jgi:hypothetical protein
MEFRYCKCIVCWKIIFFVIIFLLSIDFNDYWKVLVLFGFVKFTWWRANYKAGYHNLKLVVLDILQRWENKSLIWLCLHVRCWWDLLYFSALRSSVIGYVYIIVCVFKEGQWYDWLLKMSSNQIIVQYNCRNLLFGGISQMVGYP